MPESAIDLQRNVKPFIAKANIGAQQRFRHRLPGHIAVFAIFKTDSATIQISNTIGISPVAVGNESTGMRKIKDTQRLAYYLINNMIVSAVKAGSVKTRQTLILRRRNILSIVIAAQG